MTHDEKLPEDATEDAKVMTIGGISRIYGIGLTSPPGEVTQAIRNRPRGCARHGMRRGELRQWRFQYALCAIRLVRF